MPLVPVCKHCQEDKVFTDNAYQGVLLSVCVFVTWSLPFSPNQVHHCKLYPPGHTNHYVPSVTNTLAKLKSLPPLEVGMVFFYGLVYSHFYDPAVEGRECSYQGCPFDISTHSQKPDKACTVCEKVGMALAFWKG